MKIPKVDVGKEFPEIYKHLQAFEEQLVSRLDQGDHWTNLRNCAYIFEFEKEKVVWQELSRSGNSFCYVDEPYYLTNTAYALTGVPKETLKYFTAILNSRVSLFYLEKVYNKLDETGWRWLKNAVEKIPIPQMLSCDLITSFVDAIQSSKQKGLSTTDKEEILESEIYKLFGLTDIEIKFLQTKFKIKY